MALFAEDIVYGYQYNRAGLFGYTYLENGKEICATSERNVPKALVRISGKWGSSWQSKFDRDVTLFPGLKFTIEDTDTKQEAFQIVFLSFSTYIIKCGAEKIISAEDRFGFNYYSDEEWVASCWRKPQAAPAAMLFGKQTPAHFKVELRGQIGNQMKQAILAFPSLIRIPPSHY